MAQDPTDKTQAMAPDKPEEAPASGSNPIPRQLGHYEIGEKIGQGGMAVVYRGVQPSLNRAVAIKVLPTQFTNSPELLGRFEREASIISQLNHSNIVQVIDRGKEDDVLYIVMEFVDGKSLDKLIAEKTLTTAEISDYTMQICDGLAYAHSQGVVHRDLKPANIIIDQSGRVKIADFGIAAIETTGGMLATLTYDNVAIGTMNYMSPEQRVDAHRVTHLADIFSLGVILYEMLTGRLPIGHFKLPSLLRSDMPLGFDTIVKKCLSESPGDRYQSADAIHAELSHLTGRHTRIDRPGMAVLGRMNKKQRWYVMGGVALLCVVAVTGLVVSLTRPGKDAPPAAPSPRETTPAAPAPIASESQEMIDAKIESSFARAQGFISSAKYEDAISILSDLVRRYSTSGRAPEFQFMLANAYYDLGEKEKCKIEYDRLIQNFADSPRVPEAIISKCRAEWETAPRKKKLLGGFEYDSALQQRLVDVLLEQVEKGGTAAYVPAALQLIAEVAQPERLAKERLAAETLARLYEVDRASGPDSIYHAAELYDRKLKDSEAAMAAYESYLKDFPGESRAERAAGRVKEMREAMAEAAAAAVKPETAPKPEVNPETPPQIGAAAKPEATQDE